MSSTAAPHVPAVPEVLQPAPPPLPVRSRLHRVDPYRGFDAASRPLDLQGWNGEHPVFRQLIQDLKPRLVLEVGTWKGQSATTMARALAELGPGRELVCIDTWLGAVEFWQDLADPERHVSLGLQHGYPSVYYQFLANVVHCGLQDVVTPFPQTSLNAARWLLQQRIQADLVYIDGSHEFNDVLADLEYYWLCAKPGAVLFGDDAVWPGVLQAVQAFAAATGEALRFHDNHYWLFRKP